MEIGTEQAGLRSAFIFIKKAGSNSWPFFSRKSSARPNAGRIGSHAAWLVLLAVAAAIFSLIALNGYQDYRNIRNELQSTATFSAQMMSKNASRVLGEAALGLDAISQFMEEQLNSPFPVTNSKIRSRLFGRLAEFRHMKAIAIVDTEGRVLHAAGTVPSYRFPIEDGKALLRKTGIGGAGLMFHISGIDDTETARVTVAQEIRRPNGELHSIVAAVLDLRVFRPELDGRGRWDSEVHSYLTSGNTMLAHLHGMQPASTKKGHGIEVPNWHLPTNAAGTMQASGSGGKQWLISYVRLPNRQFLSVSKVPVRRIWALWLPRRMPSLVLAAIAIALIAMYTTVTTRQMSRRIAAEAEIRSLNVDLEHRVEVRTTELRESEERFRNMTANVPGAVYQQIAQPDGNMAFSYIGQGVFEITGYTPEALIAEPSLLLRHIYDSDRYRVANALKESCDTLAPLAVDFRLKHRDGKYRWISSVARPRKREDGAIVFDGVIFDITHRKRTEEDLKKAKDEADKANRAKSSFLANMSHELRTPLNAVIGMSEVMMTQVMGPMGSEKYVEYADAIHESGAHLLEIITDILDISAIENDALVPIEEPVDIGSVVEASLRLIRSRAEQKGIDLIADIADGMEPVMSDRRMMKQILLNLASNAIKFTPERGSVTLSAFMEPDGTAVMRVADTGIGIKEQDLARVMEPFAQVEDWESKSNEGSGLGLPLVVAMTKLHGGSFHLDSEFGVGTTATVRLPSNGVAELKVAAL